jgi:L-alanine-DL-glutamate epimerase-like enolase superfamily enzyme
MTPKQARPEETALAGTRIEKVLIEPLNIELDEPFTIAIGKKERVENAVITVVLENGIEGYGEAAPLEPINGENQATALAVLNSCRDFLVGQDATDYRSISRRLESIFRPQNTARCAVEMALLDAFTRTLNIPLYRFFGGVQNRIETDYTIDIVPPETARKDAARLAAEGYRILKIKVGSDPGEDIGRLLAIREGAPDCRVTVDANQGFTPAQAVGFMNELEKRDIRPVLFEQPVARDDLEGMRFVRDHVPVPVAADESVFTPADAVRVVRTGCADIINIKTMKSGLLGALDIAAVARSARVDLMIGCMLESTLSKSASVHLAAGLGGFRYIDLDPHAHPERDPFTGGPAFEAPAYTLDDERPGIGVRRR